MGKLGSGLHSKIVNSKYVASILIFFDLFLLIIFAVTSFLNRHQANAQNMTAINSTASYSTYQGHGIRMGIRMKYHTDWSLSDQQGQKLRQVIYLMFYLVTRKQAPYMNLHIM